MLQFVEKAPEEVVRGVREKATEAEERLKLTKNRLSLLESSVSVWGQPNISAFYAILKFCMRLCFPRLRLIGADSIQSPPIPCIHPESSIRCSSQIVEFIWLKVLLQGMKVPHLFQHEDRTLDNPLVYTSCLFLLLGYSTAVFEYMWWYLYRKKATSRILYTDSATVRKPWDAY